MKTFFALLSVMLGSIGITMYAGDNFNQSATYYCSSSQGDDTYAGTYAKPFKTINKALETIGNEKSAKILLKRGDTFYESVTLRGNSIGAYGGGNPPVISGAIIPPENYKPVRGDVLMGSFTQNPAGKVWRYDLAQLSTSSIGYRVKDDSNGHSSQNNIGGLINISTGNLINIHKCAYLIELTRNYFPADFYCYQANPNAGQELPAENYDYLYVYYDGDITDLNIGFAAGCSGVTVYRGEVRDVTIENFGKHGVESNFDCIVDNCKINNIGGMYYPFIPSQNNNRRIILIGNGVECYVTDSRQNITVSNCHVSHCYDAGLTVQGNGENKDLSASNILFEYNIVRNCGQGYEDFLRGKDANTRMFNVNVMDNVFMNMGADTGFDYYTYNGRYQYKVTCGILSANDSIPTHLNVSRNQFINCNFLMYHKTMSVCPITLSDNIVHICEGEDILTHNYFSSKIVSVGDRLPMDAPVRYSDALNDSIDSYRSKTGDMTTRFIVYKSSADIMTAFERSFSPLSVWLVSKP